MAQVNHEGQPCPHCGTPVIRQGGKIKHKSALQSKYYYKWFYKCMQCRAVYFDGAAKTEITEEMREKVLGQELFNEKTPQAESLF